MGAFAQLRYETGFVSTPRLSAWFAVVLALIVSAVALLGGNALAGVLLTGPASDDLITAIARRTVVYLFLFAPLYAFAFVANHAFDQQPVYRRSQFSIAAGLLTGGGIGALAFGVTLALTFAAGVVRVGNTTAGANIAGIVFAAVLTIWQAGAEEWLFRGWLQPVLTKAWGALPGIAVGALAFAAAHVFLELPSALAIFNTFLAGCVFGAIAVVTGRVSAAIAAHAAWNWVEQSVAGLTPNPGVDSLTSIFDLDLAGPVLMSGAEDGLTGALTTTLVLALIFATLAAIIANTRVPNH